MAKPSVSRSCQQDHRHGRPAEHLEAALAEAGHAAGRDVGRPCQVGASVFELGPAYLVEVELRWCRHVAPEHRVLERLEGARQHVAEPLLVEVPVLLLQAPAVLRLERVNKGQEMLLAATFSDRLPQGGLVWTLFAWFNQRRDDGVDAGFAAGQLRLQKALDASCPRACAAAAAARALHLCGVALTEKGPWPARQGGLLPHDGPADPSGTVGA
mmetsp:Transcript_5357/g.17291  ORF Transcript_5357/g.17291 Transcript_5357/m.17291 type:complete len:213 (+) Transcript_5357:2409-3047(+)